MSFDDEVTTYTHNDYTSNVKSAYINDYTSSVKPAYINEYEEIINNYVSRTIDRNADGTPDSIANNTFDIYGNITSHDRDNNADGTSDYTVTFLNTYRTEKIKRSAESAENLTDADVNDIITGLTGNDTIYGYGGDDELNGGWGDDNLNGGYGDDNLNGGRGRDIIHGGAGADVLSGNQNSDIFVFTNANDSSISNPDIIVDFTAGSDKLLLNFPNFAPTTIGSVNSLDEANAYFNGSTSQAAFSATESILYLDSTAQGMVDMVINLNNVTSLDMSDFA